MMISLSFSPLSAEDLAQGMYIPNTVRKCWNIGKQIISARKNLKNPIKSIFKCVQGYKVFKGKIIQVIFFKFLFCLMYLMQYLLSVLIKVNFLK